MDGQLPRFKGWREKGLQMKGLWKGGKKEKGEMPRGSWMNRIAFQEELASGSQWRNTKGNRKGGQ
jgi:hypothetical protein